MSLVLGIRYLTGYAVATDPTSRERAEWPPHPARVFMAMAAAHFETDKNTGQAEALRWLETLPDPHVHSADADERPVVTTYVPINDDPIGKKPGLLQSVSGWPRSKQPRTFPRVRPHDETMYLVWPGVELNGHRAALERLCAKVTRIGHSSSFVQMWVADGVPGDAPPAWEPDDVEADVRLRVFGTGSLEYLEGQYGQHDRDSYHSLNEQIDALKAQKTAIKGKGSQARKAEIQEQIDTLEEELPDAPPRDPLRPVMSLWQGYRRERPKLDATVPRTVWDPYLTVRRLEPMESRHLRLDLASTLQVTAAMHKAVISQAKDPVPEFISGHKPDGSPTDQPHLAYLPLAFVGREHATGHLMGLAIAVPTELDQKQRQEALAAVGRVEELTIGSLGRWKLDREDQGLLNLRPEVWTGGNDGATQWATVTPIAFDKHAKAKDHAGREQKLADMIKKGCVRIRLTEPKEIIITPVSAHLGVPAAHEFPRLQRKDGSDRRHAHAILIFDKPVRGPIAIGAGRYRGYGFCRPLRGGEGVG